MKKIFFVAAMLLLSCQLFAQQAGQTRTARPGATPAALPPPIATRDIHGIVKDSKGETVIGANVVLSSKLDTLRAATNADGVFIFHGVKSNDFYLNVSSMGYTTTVVHNRVSDTKKDVTLDPVTLKDDSKELGTVTINGTPSITYKPDTVEYKASDYKVRENSTVDELLKHMEGFEVGSDGTVTHQGQTVSKARLNGRDYAGGNLAQAIQSLPADIVEKIQVVDDYGDQAARTGIKDGDPQKVLNITTLANKSVGNIGRITLAPGTSDRYNYNLFYNRINANQVITLNATTSSTVPGVVNSGAGSGQGGFQGNSNNGQAGVIKRSNINTSYRDQISKTTQINGSYTYSINDQNITSKSNGASYPSVTDRTTGKTITATSIDTSSSAQITHGYSHAFTFDYEWQPDSQNYIRIRPNYNYNYSYGTSSSIDNSVGYKNQISNSSNITSSESPTFSLNAFYQFLFKHDHRQNISVQYTYNNRTSNSTIGTKQDIFYRNPAAPGGGQDSLVNRSTTNNQVTKTNTLTLQYAQPLSKPSAAVQSFLEFNEQYTRNDNSVNKIQSNVLPTGALSRVDSLTNIYNYSFSQGNFALNYRRNSAKSQLTLGVRAITAALEGHNISRGTSTNHNDFYVIPVVRYQYNWTRTEQISLYYQGNANEPSFAQIQPVPDYSNNPQNPIFGNPNLDPSFTHSLTAAFNNYLANSKFNMSIRSVTSITQDQIAQNDIVYAQTLKSGAKNIIDETHFLNTNGGLNENVTYNFAKQLDNRAYNLELNGSMAYGVNPIYNNSVRYEQTSWLFNERFGPIITPNTTFEFRPYVSYQIQRNFSTLPSNNPAVPNSSQITTTMLDLNGRVFLGSEKRFTFSYDISKNYQSGIAGFNNNPFIVNAYVDYEFFARKNGILRFSAFDVFKQAVFLNHNVTSFGYTNTESNTLSRYFTLSFILNLQKFSGTPQRNGRPMMRRGDGSFIVD